MTPPTNTEGAVTDVTAYPNIRRVGSYAFFAWLAFWATMPVYALGRWLDLPRDMTSLASTIVMLATFLALRDMLKLSPHLTEQGVTAS